MEVRSHFLAGAILAGSTLDDHPWLLQPGWYEASHRTPSGLSSPNPLSIVS